MTGPEPGDLAGGVGGGTNPAGEREVDDVIDNLRKIARLQEPGYGLLTGEIEAAAIAADMLENLRAVVEGLRTQLDAVSKDYRTLWGMTLGHDGQPPTDGTPDDVQRLRERAAALEAGLG